MNRATICGEKLFVTASRKCTKTRINEKLHL